MTIDQFRGVMKLQPFRPFTLRMADGRSFEIRHPELIALSPTGRTLFIFNPDDSFQIVDLLLMTELDVQALNEQSA